MSNGKDFVVITSINAPTRQVRRWAKLWPGRTMVVGDAKTPTGWECEGVHFVTPLNGLQGSLTQLIGPNKYQRKMLGYAAAISHGAEVIIDSDDDNEPLEMYILPEFTPGKRGPGLVCSTPGWVNVYRMFGEYSAWPRGLPLLSKSKHGERHKELKGDPIGVWQGLAQVDPDVDAIYRLTSGTIVNFDEYRMCVALSPGTLSPFNSQATMFRRECFPLLYLPCTVSMRVCDILRSYVAQPIMWAAGYRLGFGGPIVRQERNQHDLMDDFAQELPLYMGMGESVVSAVQAVVSPTESMEDNLRVAYRSIIGIHGIGDESAALEEWLSSISVKP